jgi:nitrogenase molybdenum-iron protein alpha chain
MPGKGVVLGHIKYELTLTHGPWIRYYPGEPKNKGEDGKWRKLYPVLFFHRSAEPDIVFGGRKNYDINQRSHEIFHPKCIIICSTCPFGDWDDIHAVAAETEEQYGITCIAFSCDGYKGVIQSGGHHIANNGLMLHIIGTPQPPAPKEVFVNILAYINGRRRLGDRAYF